MTSGSHTPTSARNRGRLSMSSTCQHARERLNVAKQHRVCRGEEIGGSGRAAGGRGGMSCCCPECCSGAPGPARVSWSVFGDGGCASMPGGCRRGLRSGPGVHGNAGVGGNAARDCLRAKSPKSDGKSGFSPIKPSATAKNRKPTYARSPRI